MAVQFLEMPDGARLLLDESGWKSDSRQALASILNRFYPPESNLSEQADRIARRFRWQFVNAPKTALNGSNSVLGTNTAGSTGKPLEPPPASKKQAI